MAVRVTAGF